jgi:hypothetical protein
MGTRIFNGKIQIFSKKVKGFSKSISTCRFRHKNPVGHEQKLFLRVDTIMKRYNCAACKHVVTSIQERVYHETVRQVYPETFNFIPFKGAFTIQKSAACSVLSFS